MWDPFCFVLKMMISRDVRSITMSVNTFKGWTPFYNICWWYSRVGPLCYIIKLMISSGGPFFSMSVDTLLHYMLMISRGGTPFAMYSNIWFPGLGPLCYVIKLIISRGGPFFTMSVDTFKEWTPFYTIFWWYSWVGPLLLCTQNVSIQEPDPFVI